MAETKTVRLVGEGGSEIEFDLPLAPVYVEQITKGTLKPVDDDAAETLAESGVLQGPSNALSPSSAVERMRELEAREAAVAEAEAALKKREQAAATTDAKGTGTRSKAAQRGKGAS